MQILTLIPDADSYGICTFALFSLSSFHLSNFIYSRWFSKSKAGILQVNILIKALIVIMGFLLIPARNLFGSNLLIQIISIPIGLFIGITSVYFEKFVMRNHFRKNWKKSSINFQSETSLSNEVKIKSRSLFVTKNEPNRRQIGLKKIADYKNIGMDWKSLMIVAILEEFIFRGFLLTICKELIHSYPLKLFAILATIIIFGLSHLLNGNAQMKSKIFFAVITTIACIAVDTLVPAIIAHCYLNNTAYKLSEKNTVTNNSLVFS